MSPAIRLSLIVILLLSDWLILWANAESEGQVPPARSREASQYNGSVLRKDLMCGPNSLYMFLALNGVPVNPGLVRKYIPSRGEGMSLVELKEACIASGFSAEVRHCSIEELGRQFKSPVVALLSRDTRHHYVIVLEITNSTVTMLDGTTGAKKKVTIQWLKNGWSGYVLMPNAGLLDSWLLFLISLFGWLLLGFIVMKRWPKKNLTKAAIVQQQFDF